MFKLLAAELLDMIFSDVLEHATNIVVHVIKIEGATRIHSVERAIKDRDGKNINRLALVNKLFAGELLPRFAALPQIFDIDSPAAVPTLYMLRPQQQAVIRRSTIAKYHFKEQTFIEDIPILHRFARLQTIWLNSHVPVRLDQMSFEEAGEDGRENYILGCAVPCFVNMLNDYRSCTFPTQGLMDHPGPFWILSTPGEFVHNTGKIENMYIECHLRTQVDTVTRFESRGFKPDVWQNGPRARPMGPKRR